MNARLFIGNLSFSIGDDALRQTFAAAGTVISAEVVRDRFDGRSRGFGFVEMATAEEALAAARELNGKELGGRAMRVEAATSTRPAERRASEARH